MTTAAATEPPPRLAPHGRVGGARMRAHARVGTVLDAPRGGPDTSRLAVLRSEGALMLRPTIARRDEPFTHGLEQAVRVSVVAGAAGPVGGDHWELDVHVGAGSTLVLTEISHTLCLPGRDGAQSVTQLRATVEEDASLIWLPEPLIAAHRCHHLTDLRITLAGSARLLVREELLLGRYGEPSGRLRQRTQVLRAGRPVYHQDLNVGGKGNAAVTGPFTAIGSALVVDPTWSAGPPPAADLGELAALLPLASGAVLVTALAPDSLTLRRSLDTGVQALGPPWSPA